MATRLICVYFALALFAAFAGFKPAAAHASPVTWNKPSAVHSFAAPAAFRTNFARPRFRGGRMGGARRRSGRMGRGMHGSRRTAGSRRNTGSRTSGRGRDSGAASGAMNGTRGNTGSGNSGRGRGDTGSNATNIPPRNPGGDGPRFPSRPSGGGVSTSGGGSSNLPPLGPAGIAAGTAFTILGAGGISRPPVAPRFTGAPGQDAAQFAAALLNGKRHRPRELLVEVTAETPEGLQDELQRDYGVVVEELGTIGLARVRIWRLTLRANQDLQEVLAQLLTDSRVITAQPNYIYTPVQGAPDVNSLDERPPAPAPQSESGMPTGAGVKLAIIDTCVETAHSELVGAVRSSYDAINSGAGTCRPENHGTAVASLIAGHTHLHGTATGASLLQARAFSFTREEREVAATSREIALALNWAADAGARVANLSFAGPADPLIERVIAAAYRRGIVLVAAAGNAGPASAPLYPAAYPEVIAVTATNGKREIYSAANRGKHISVSARGVDVVVAHVQNGYGVDSGTSFAAAKVSGIVAGLIEKRPRATPGQIKAALQNTAIGVPGVDRDEAGFGLVNARAAIAFVETSVQQ